MKIIKKLLNRWFNFPPRPNASFITNNKGEKYWYFFYGNSLDDVYFYNRGREVAKILLLWEVDKLEISDFVIYTPRKKSWKGHRGMGFGSSMFSLLKEIAKDNGISSIWGMMHPENPSKPQEWERLRRFYLRQGCSVQGKFFYIKIK